jgi:hypothetical protein
VFLALLTLTMTASPRPHREWRSARDRRDPNRLKLDDLLKAIQIVSEIISEGARSRSPSNPEPPTWDA